MPNPGEMPLNTRQLATAKHPDNYHLLDTKGQVYRHQLERHYDKACKVKHHTAVKVEEALVLAEYAQEATEVFKREGELSLSMNSKSASS